MEEKREEARQHLLEERDAKKKESWALMRVSNLSKDECRQMERERLENVRE